MYVWCTQSKYIKARKFIINLYTAIIYFLSNNFLTFVKKLAKKNNYFLLFSFQILFNIQQRNTLQANLQKISEKLKLLLKKTYNISQLKVNYIFMNLLLMNFDKTQQMKNKGFVIIF